MAIQTIYLLATTAVTPNFFGNTQLNGSAPTSASTAYGWGPAKNSPPAFFRGRLGATATASTLTTTSYNASTSGPAKGTGTAATTAGDSFISGPFAGTFATGTWTFNWNLRAGTAGCVGNINMRVWKSSNADGTSATQLLANTAGATVTLSTTADGNSSISTSAIGALTLNNEYLFFQVEWQETTQGSSNNDNVFFRTNTSTIVTPDFVQTAPANATIAGVGSTSAKGNKITSASATPTSIASVTSNGNRALTVQTSISAVGSVAADATVSAGGPPSTTLVTSFTPGSDRTGYTGWVGVKFTPTSDLLITSYGLRRATGNLNPHSVMLTLDNTDSPATQLTTYFVDLTVGSVGTFYYVPADPDVPITLTAGTSYNLITYVSIDGSSILVDGQSWAERGPVTMSHATNIQAVYCTGLSYSPDTGDMAIAAANQMFYGIDLNGTPNLPVATINIFPGGLPAWAGGTAYTVGQRVVNFSIAFECIIAGTSSTTNPGPSNPNADYINDDTTVWKALGPLHFTSFADAFSSTGIEALAPWPFVQDTTVQIWRPASGAITEPLEWYPTGSSSFTLTITAAPGESFRDHGDIPLFYDDTKGVVIGIGKFDIEVDCPIIIDGLQIGDYGPYLVTPAATIRNCIFQGDGSSTYSELDFSGPITLTNNLFYDYAIVGPNATIINNTIIIGRVARSGMTLRNNVIVGLLGGSYVTFSSSAAGTADHNVTDQADFSPSSLTDGGGNLFSQSATALFVDPSSDFRLKTGSPALDIGATVTLTDDIFRTPRPSPYGGSYDIGAYEIFVPTTLINIFPGLAPWATATAYTVGQRVGNGGNAYECITAGTSSGGPSGTGTNITDGTAHWKYLAVVHFTALVDAFNGLHGGINAMAPWPFRADTTVQIWRTTSGAITENLNWWPVGSSTYTFTITAAPGESFRDNGDIPLFYDVTKGVAITGGIDIEADCPVVIDGLQFINCGYIYFYIGGNNSTIQNCIVDDTAGDIDVDGLSAGKVLLVNNLIRGINLPHYNFSTTLVNNTLIDSNVSSFGTTIQNNIFADTSFDSDATGPADHNVLDQADFLPSSLTDAGGNLYSQSATALFVDPAADYRLKTGSPALDVGATVALTDDILRTTRPQGSAYDVGAYELLAAATLNATAILAGLGSVTANPIRIAVVTLTTAGSATWTVPADCPAGTAIDVQLFGGGSGGSGRNSAGNSFGAGGAGGGYVDTPFYIVTPNDVANGIPYVIGAGSAGVNGANPVAGGLSSWSNNNLNKILNSTHTQAIVGSPGTLPGNWNVLNLSGLTRSIVAIGTTSDGYAYIDWRLSGTSTGGTPLILAQGQPTTVATWTASLRAAIVGGSLTNVSGMTLGVDANNGGSYVGTPVSNSITLTSTLTQFNATAAMTAGTNNVNMYLTFTVATGPVDVTIRMAAMQFELGSTVTAWKSTPCYTAATGGGAPSGTTGGVGSSSANVIGFSGSSSAGGSGANYNVNGAGGGGAASLGSNGVAGTTAGQGGASGFGTPGGAVKTTSPGNPGGSDPTGGAGGGGLKTVTGIGGAGGAPGGGGGGSAVGSGTSAVGGAGASGQAILTYVPSVVGAASRSGSATIAGIATVTATPTAGINASATFSGLGSVTATAILVVSASASISGLGSVSANASKALFASSTISGTGSVTANATTVTVGINGSATLAGAGSVSATGTLQTNSSATLAGAGSVTASGAIRINSSATLAGAGSVTATGSIRINSSVAIAGAGSVTATGAIRINSAATLAGTGSVTATGAIRINSSIALAGTGSVTASGTLLSNATATLAGAGSVSAEGTIVGGNVSVNLLGAAISALAGIVTSRADNLVPLTGAELAALAGTVIAQYGNTTNLNGAEINSGAGVVTVPGSGFMPVQLTGAGITATAGTFGIPVVNIRVYLHGAGISVATNNLSSETSIAMSGAEINGQGAGPSLRLSSTGFAMTTLLVAIGLPLSDDDAITLAWSDDSGATYSHPIQRSLGQTGEYFTSVTWRRLGMGRSRVFVFEWSVPALTALTGAFVEVTESQS